MGAGAQARPRAWAQYTLASNTNIAGVAGTTAILNMSVDTESFFNTFFDKPTNERIRALQAMKVRVSYGLGMDANVNDEGYRVRVLKTGTVIPQSVSGSTARAAIAEGSNVSRTFITSLAANDYLELQVEKLEGNTLTVISAATIILVELVELG